MTPDSGQILRSESESESDSYFGSDFHISKHTIRHKRLPKHRHHLHNAQSIAVFVQTEAERRRRGAGVQQAMENGLRPCLYVVSM